MIRDHFKHVKNPILDDFQCRDCQSHGGNVADCCLPACCPDPLPTRKYPSPNSSLSPDELHELMMCMESVNHLLQALGNPRDEGNLRALQLEFWKLKGMFVKADIKCGDNHECISGGLTDAGLDFLMMEQTHEKYLIPFRNIVLLEHMEGHDEHMEDPVIAHMNPCVKRELVLYFSEIVSKSPYLINLFFGLTLSLFLETLKDSMIFVQSFADGKTTKKAGKLIAVSDTALTIKKSSISTEIKIDEVCFIHTSEEHEK